MGGKAQRTNFSKSPTRNNPEAGAEHLVPFGEDKKQKITFGGKYKWKPDNNPPPG